MPSQKQNMQGLLRLLSAETPPLYPELREPKTATVNLENWFRQWYEYTRRLHGFFTAENIVTTINTGGGGIDSGYDKLLNLGYKYKGTNSPTFTIDNTVDWRTVWIDYNIVAAPTYADLTNVGTNAKTSGIGFYYPNIALTQVATLNIGFTTITVNIDAATGALLGEIDNVSSPTVSESAAFDVVIRAYGKVVPSASLISVGNGL